MLVYWRVRQSCAKQVFRLTNCPLKMSFHEAIHGCGDSFPHSLAPRLGVMFFFEPAWYQKCAQNLEKIVCMGCNGCGLASLGPWFKMASKNSTLNHLLGVTPCTDIIYIYIYNDGRLKNLVD